MKLSFPRTKILLLILLGTQTILLCGCNLDIAPSYTSANIDESKKNGFFLCEYVIDSLQLADKKKKFVITNAWAEVRHSITTNAWGKDTYEKDDSFFQIDFDIASESYYKDKNNNRWFMVDENGQWDSWEDKILYMGADTKVPPSKMKFKIYWQKNEMDFKHDTTKVCEFFL